MDTVVDVDYSRFDRALAAILANSKRDAVDVMMTQARGVIKNIIAITPPAHVTETATVMRGAAKAHGEALVAKDIRGIYGTPAQAFDRIRGAGIAPGADKGFWRHLKHGELDQANAILTAAHGRKIYPFDGGQAHRNLKRGRARPGNKSILFYVADVKELNAYIKTVQGRVGWLAAGWNQAAAKLGVQPLGWVWRHSAPGKALVEISDNGVKITMTNQVKFAREAADMERRVQWALDQQAGNMERLTKQYLETLVRRAGLTITGGLA